MNTDDLEPRLREALNHQASRIQPHDRRTQILAMAHDETKIVSPARRWLIPGAAAASVALIGAVIWGVTNGGGSSQQASPALRTTTATTTTAASQAAPTPSTAIPPPTALATQKRPIPTSGAGVTTLGTVPAYFVGAVEVSSNKPRQFGLYRDFVQTAVPPAATAAQRAKAAIAIAMKGSTAPLLQLPGYPYKPYLSPWAGTSVTNVTVPAGRIAITLSGPGVASGFTPAQTRLAVQELVWTAQAAVGQGNLPVSFDIAGGSATLFGSYPTAQTYNRPPADLQYQVLAPIWITSPVRDQVLPSGASVTATGQSCAFEGTTAWQLRKGQSTFAPVLRSGVTRASSGCPTRGTWQVKLGVLPAGSYLFRMYEVSMKDGQVAAETTEVFTVK